MNWEKATSAEIKELMPSFQRSARHRGVLPVDVFVVRSANNVVIYSATKYVETDKWIRWCIQQHPAQEIKESWSTIQGWLRDLIGDQIAIEVYPRTEQVLNTAPNRWFWILPTPSIPFQYDLRPMAMLDDYEDSE